MERHKLEKEFLTYKMRYDHGTKLEDYGEMGQLKTEQENKNFRKWGSDAFKNLKLGDDHYNKENLHPEVETVFFTFPEAGKKSTIFKGFEFAHRQIKMQEEKGDKSQANLFIPEIVQIDYSEYSNVPTFENNIYAKPYKDGIMLVTEVEKGNRACLALRLGNTEHDLSSDKNGHPSNATIDGKIVAGMFQSKFRNFGQIDWASKNFDKQLVFYVVVPGIVKNKAARIVFKNNIKADRLIKLFRSGPPRKLPTGDFKHFFEKTTKIQDLLLGIHLCQEDEKYKKTYDYNNYPKHSLLQAGYQGTLMELSNYCIVAKDNGYGREEFYEHIQEYKNKSLEEIKQEYMKNIFPFEKDLEISIIQNIKWSNEEKNKTLNAYFYKNFLKMVVFYYHTEEGTTLCNGLKINTEEKSRVDCLLFWRKIDLFEVLFNVLNDKNFPLCMRNSQIINDVDIFDPILNSHMNMSGQKELGTRPEAQQGNKFGKIKFEFKDKHILQQAMDSQTGYLMPYDGAFELLHDHTFNFIRFREYQDFITIVVCDKNERYFVEVFSKEEVDFKYMLWNQLKFNENYSEDCLQDIYTKFATCIRDAKVLIERDSSMQYQGRRKPYGSNTNSTYHFYFPRVKYRRNPNAAQKKREKDFFNESRKFGGTRRAHTRRLTDNQKPSKKQMLLAKRLDIWIPNGHTFVKETEWGNNRTKREIKYRNTALNGVFYYDEKEVSEAKKIDQMSDGQFEEYCKERIKKLGYSIKTSQNYDGGIDIRAVKILDNHDTEYLLVQCKHWNKPIPPGEMRDFKTACDMEESKYKKTYMFMASGKFSPGAREIAERFNIELVDGDDLLKC